MNKTNLASPAVTNRIFMYSLCRALFACIVVVFLSVISAHAQTSEYWVSSSDNYTNGPVGGDWNPAISGTTTNWPDNFNGSPSSSSGYIMAITNSGTCNYAGSPAGDPNYTNVINDLYLGGTGNGTGGGGISNNFVMAGGSLTLADPNGPSFAVGGTATGGKVGAQSTNYFTMTGGTLMATSAIANANGGCVVGYGTNSMGTVNFNGGTAILSDLVIGGHGAGIVNINGGNVIVTGTDTNGLRAISFVTQAKGSGTLNLMSGTLTVTNSQIDLGHGAIAGQPSTLNVSGGTLNVTKIEFSTGAATKATNIINLSGGTINFSSGTGQSGKTTNFFIMSGGTISCLPGSNPTFSGDVIANILTNAPGPGIVTFAPPAGQSMTLPAISGNGGIIVAGPGSVIIGSTCTYSSNTIVSGGILSLSTAGSISSPIIIAGNATFDVSEQASAFTLASGQVLSNSTSTAIINGSLNTGSGMVSLLYASGTPSFTVTTNNSVNNTNANAATLTLSATTTFKINNTGSALGVGNYLIISTNIGANIAGTLPVVTVMGGGIQAGDTASLSTSIDGQLYLVVTALPPPPGIGAQSPVTYTNLFTLYAGANPTFSISASSAVPISYQWFTNGVGVSWATNASFTLTNVQPGFLTNYCVASNYVGSTTSSVWMASVIPAPASYPSNVLTLNPVAYWRLNDINLDGSDNGNGDDGYVANDYAGGNDGIYTNVSIGQSSYNPTADPSDYSVQFGETQPYSNNYAGQIQGIDFTATNGANAEFSVEAWANGFVGAQMTGGAVVTKGLYNINDEFNLGMDSSATHHYRFYVRNAVGSTFTADSSFAPDGNWHHLVGVCDEANGAVSLYIDGQLAASTAIPANSGEYEASGPVTIGAGIGSANASLQFFGNVNDVALFNHALNASQIANEYVHALNVGPYFIQAPPANTTIGAGSTLVLSPVTAAGTTPLGYQWFDVNGNAIASAQGVTNALPVNASLTYNNIPANWNNGRLELTVSNAYGITNVFVALSVAGTPIIETNIPPQITLGQGQSYTYTLGVVAATAVPLYYQWLTNGVPDTTAGTAANYSLTGVQGSMSGETYECIITNIYGAATSVLSALTVLPPMTNFTYSSNILALNPVGYWPMHEVEYPTHGDTETNYGSLGLLGAGFYADWVSPDGPGGIQHYVGGALANDTNPAVAFPGELAAGDFVECMSIPHSSPLTTLNPPFSIECWFFPSNDDTGDIWSQCGYEGLNAGSYGAGQGSIAGIRLFWNGPSFYLYTYYTASTLHQVGHIHELPGSWYHLVVTCDPNTNMILYVDGVPAFTNQMAGLYTPDYWSPLTLANGKGYNNSMPGSMDEFSTYSTALGAADIAQKYNDGISGPSGAYATDVMNDNPLIYYRMDSPAYTPPITTSILPVLVNYGSSGVNGVYSVGTAPGLVNGATYGGFPLGGLSGTNVADMSGVSSFADAGYAAAYNPIGSNALSVSAIFRGNPADERNQTIVGHTSSSWRLWVNTTGNLEWQIGGTTLTSAGIYNDGDWHHVVAVYSPASNPALSGTNLLYVDGALDSSVSTVSTNGITVGSTSDVLIGSDPQYTNNPAGLGQQFAGEICEVALFTNALTAVQAQKLYNSYGVSPFIDGQPITGRTVYGGAGSYIFFGVDAGGTPSLAYQWYYDSTQSYAGATQLPNNMHYSNSTTLEVTVTNLTAADSGYYFAIITNNYGSVTSILASLTVTANPTPTNLVASVINNQLTLSWPSDHTGWELQAQTNSVSSGIGANWIPVAGSTNVNQVVMSVNPANGCVFYRLVYPPQ